MASVDYTAAALQYALRPIGGTDLLAFREVAAFFQQTKTLGKALDVGCGTGRSTRFLSSCGLNATGLDVSESMLSVARQCHGTEQYYLYSAGTEFPFLDGTFDLTFSSWVLLELSTREELRHLVSEIGRVLRPHGLAVFVSNTSDFYRGQWISSDVDYPENTWPLCSGQQVRAKLLPEDIVVNDTYWDDLDYRRVFSDAGLQTTHALYPMATLEDGIDWKDEIRLAPYVVYITRKR